MTTAPIDRRAMLAGLGCTLAALPAIGRVRRRLLARDDFRHGLGQWVAEAEQPAAIEARDGILDIDAPAGLTLWFRFILAGRIAIEYSAQAVREAGPPDRVSDLNCFWMAQDPAAPDGDVLHRPRSGRFADYDDLRLYYVGIGGNSNGTTRFRRYIGAAGDRPLLPDNDRRAPADLLVPNAWQRLSATADDAAITFARDGRQIFSLTDDAPYRRGRFALRTTASHLRIRDFAVYSLA